MTDVFRIKNHNGDRNHASSDTGKSIVGSLPWCKDRHLRRRTCTMQSHLLLHDFLRRDRLQNTVHARERRNRALSRVNNFVNSRNVNDYALCGMKLSNCLCHDDFDHYNRTHSTFRSPERRSLPEFAALFKINERFSWHPSILWSTLGLLDDSHLTNPIGLIDIENSISLDFNLNPLEGEITNLVNIYANTLGWHSASHNSMDQPFYNIYNWYHTVFQLNSSIIPSQILQQ